MRRWITAVVAVAAAVLPGAASGAALVPLAPPTAWESSPIHATAPAGDPRLFVVERGGGVRIVEDGVRKEPFLTVPNVDTSGERGLLSIAFAPDYASSGLLYVFTVAKGADELDPAGVAGDLRIVEYSRSASDPDLADPDSARLVLKIAHSAGNHNGGQLAFGPDGLLYMTVGDNATASNAQALGNLFGKVLRIDPREPEGGGGTYTVPASNPFVGVTGAREEIFTLGLRNPYRASFALNGSLVVADVGQNDWEEVNAGDLAEANLGWPECEGFCSPPDPELTDPFFQYSHDTGAPETTGCAVIGGHVVRDPTLTGLTGRYLYGDLCRRDLRTIDLSVAGGDPQPAGLSLPDTGASLLSFGEDAGGRVYVLTSDTVYRVAPGDTPPPDGENGGGGGAAANAPATPAASAATPADFAAPGLGLEAAHRQELRGHIEVKATCSEACALRATGVLSIAGTVPGHPRARSGLPRQRRVAIELAAVSRSTQADVPARLRLGLRAKLRRRARQALEDGRSVVVRVRVRATDAAGNLTRRRVRVRLTT